MLSTARNHPHALAGTGFPGRCRCRSLPPLPPQLDERPAAVALRDALVPAPAGSDSGLSPDGRRMLEAIDSLPEDEREAFDLMRIQGLTYAEAAELLGVAPKTVQRRLDRGLQLLTERLGDLLKDEG